MRAYICEDPQKQVLYDGAPDKGGHGLLSFEFGADQDGGGQEPEDFFCGDVRPKRPRTNSESDGDQSDASSDGGPTRKKLGGPDTGNGGSFGKLILWTQKFLSPDQCTFEQAILQGEEGLDFQMKCSSKRCLEFCNRQLQLQRLRYKSLDWEKYMHLMHPAVLAIVNPGMQPIDISIEWFRKIMKHNRIPIGNFVQDVWEIMNMKVPKKNCLYLEGRSNAGKSLISNSILGSVCGVALQNIGHGRPDSLRFVFQPLRDSRCCVINECLITTDSIETYLPILGGEAVMTDVKFASPESVPRTPIIITSNKSPGQDLNPISKQAHLAALMNRFTHYVFDSFDDLREFKGAFHPMMWNELINEYVLENDQ